MQGGKKIDDVSADGLEYMTDAVEEGHRYLQGEGTDCREAIGRRKRQELWN